METIRKCSHCVDGVYVSHGFTGVDGTVYPETRRPCTTCEGLGSFPAPDFDALFEAVTTSRGAEKGKRKFRKSPPDLWKKSTKGLANRRAYYVWRLTRFHGGADVTMPMTAELFCGRDAYRKELEAFAEELAKKVYGTDLAGAHRWANALGRDIDIKGLPATAYPCGPVTDGNKPTFEREELK